MPVTFHYYCTFYRALLVLSVAYFLASPIVAVGNCDEAKLFNLFMFLFQFYDKESKKYLFQTQLTKVPERNGPICCYR